MNYKKTEVKKVINILTVVIFLTTFVGVQIHKHYSQGKLHSVAIFSEPETCCDDMDNCEMAHNFSASGSDNAKHQCGCEDKTENVKIVNTFIVSKKLQLNDVPAFENISFAGFSDNSYAHILISQQTIYSRLFPGKLPDIQSLFSVFLC